MRDADVALISSDEGRTGNAGTLAAHVKGPAAIFGILANVRTAETIDDARKIAPSLAANQSVIARSGEWLGAGFARVLRRGGAQAGVLGREREIENTNYRVTVDEQGALLLKTPSGLKRFVSGDISLRIAG